MEDVNKILDSIDAAHGQLHVHPTFRWPDPPPFLSMVMGHLHTEEHPELVEDCRICKSCSHRQPSSPGFIRCGLRGGARVYTPLGVLLSQRTRKETESCDQWLGGVFTEKNRNARKRQRRARRK